jgi:hypothetical protein
MPPRTRRIEAKIASTVGESLTRGLLWQWVCARHVLMRSSRDYFAKVIPSPNLVVLIWRRETVKESEKLRRKGMWVSGCG